MTKDDLKYGNVVEIKAGIKYLYTEDKNHNTIIVNLDVTNFDLAINQYHNDLTYDHDNLGHHYLDIMKVYKDYTLKELLWERKEKPKLTDDEKAILRNIDKEYKWIARDRSSHLYIFINEPFKIECMWYAEGDLTNLHIFKHLFQSIKWEDKEPYLIEDLLKEGE